MSRPPSVSRRLATTLFSLAAALTVGSCDGGPFACTDEFRSSVTPRTFEILVNQSYSPSVRVGTCGGRVWEDADFVLTSYDTTVVRISADGRAVIGATVGATAIDVRTTDDIALGLLAVRVTVLSVTGAL